MNYLKTLKPTLVEFRLIDIRRQYSYYRKRFFGNRVPPIEFVAILFVSPKYMKQHFGVSNKDYGFYVERDMEAFFIGLNDTQERFESYRTLLHEMAHISIDRKFKRVMGHGRHWKNEMKRLSNAGAYNLLW